MGYVRSFERRSDRLLTLSCPNEEEGRPSEKGEVASSTINAGVNSDENLNILIKHIHSNRNIFDIPNAL